MKLSYNVDDDGSVWIFHKPHPKPRMTRSDKWKKRPIVERYFAYCNLLKMIDNLSGGKLTLITNSGRVGMKFGLSVPKSRKEVEGDPHKVTPDLDNFCKAVLDAICDNDSHVHELHLKKEYSDHPYIKVYAIS